MFRIKICGITNIEDALMASDRGAQAIGLNFYPGSRRCLSAAAAQAIAAGVPNDVWRVGIFVNATADEIARTAERVPELSAVQLHGDEPAEVLPRISPQLKIVRAFRCGADGLAPLADYLAQCRDLGRMPDAVLIDANSQRAGEYGGTGRTADWQRIADERSMLRDIPLILAGGLEPLNVRAAIEAVRPDGVDVASGVEEPTGRKDVELVARFIAAARIAFQSQE